MDYHKRKFAGHTLHPETLMMGFGYDSALSEGDESPGGLGHAFVICS